MSDRYLIDDLHPEDIAMLQALYSRSPQSVTNHLEKVKAAGSGKFMDTFYVGYGHASIGDCGTTTMFIEYISMLAAKAIQDSPLYNGQEASTRYIDMSKMPVLNPLETPGGKAIQDRWMAFYVGAMDPTVAHMKTVYPIREGEDPKQYEKAIKARAFDVLRSFLPAGCTTFVAWHTTLRHASDHLDTLLHHPLKEVRALSRTMLTDFQTKYAHSFREANDAVPVHAYKERLGDDYLFNPPTHGFPTQMTCRSTLDDRMLGHWPIASRPSRVRLPHRYDAWGQITYEFLLDFGSFRDLQRHRNGVCRMPLLSTRWGFNQWYLDQLPPALRREAETLLVAQVGAIKDLSLDQLEGDEYSAELQPYVAMGFNVPCSVTRGLPGTLYLIELRTSKTVHPTMRRAAQDMATTLLEKHPSLKIHADMSQDDWDIRRGAQDIVAR